VAIGDGVSGEGATRWHWDFDVGRVVHRTLSRFPRVTANTYVCHPYCGWADRSVDFWGAGGRGDPLPRHLADTLRDFLFNMPGDPQMRHYILNHTIWTREVGYLRWRRDDHSGDLRHLHVTYNPVPTPT
jgi:hypothetical protein